MPAFIGKLLTDYYRWTLIGALVLIIGLGYGFFLNQQIVTIQTVSFTDRTKAKNDLATNQRYADALDQSIKKFHTTFSAAEIQRVSRFLPEQSRFPDILLTLNKIATSAGMKLDSVTTSQISGPSVSGPAPAPAEAPGAVATDNTPVIPGALAEDINVTFSGGTGYEQFKNFIGVIESSERIFNIITLSFSQSEEKRTTNPYAMVLRTYHLPAQAIRPIE